MHPRLRLDIGWTDLFAAAFGPPVTHKRMADLGDDIQRNWPDRTVVVGLSVRTLFDGILAVLNLPNQAPIVASAINVEGMAQIAKAHGLKLTCVDVSSETLAPEPEAFSETTKNTGAKVGLIAQLYGAKADLASYHPRTNGFLLIEDAAQAFAGDFHCGDPIADVTLFSFGPIKRASALGGAVAVFKNATLAAKLREHLYKYQQKSEMWYRLRALKYMALKALNTPVTYGLFWRGLKLLGKDPDKVIASSARGFDSDETPAAVRFQPPRRMFARIAKQLSRAHDWRQRFNAFAELTTTHASWRSLASAAWLAPMICEQPQRVCSDLRAEGFDATRGATSLRCLDPLAAPLAAEMLEKIVYLPHPTHMSDKERDRLNIALSHYTTEQELTK